MGCVREAPEIEKKKKKKDMGCVRETPHIKTKSAGDV